MPDADWKRLRALFVEAVELPPDERDAFLAARCGEDAALRRRIDRMLAADARSRDPLGAAVDAAVDAAELELATRRVGQRVGDYRVQALIAGGGMGAVYLAERADDSFRKRVAIKIVRGGLDSPELLARFRAERGILARLEHPNIARVLDGGSADDGLPFIVMEYVDGLPVDRYCAERGLGLRERLLLFLKICAAVDYAHRNLVVHRDLKPSNVLVGADGEPKLLDFGIAKLLDPEPGVGAATRTQTRFLTPAYASPEQLRGESVSTAADVYSLGVMLYVLLAGAEPFEASAADPLGLQRAILEREAPPPSQRSGDPRQRRALEGDLDTIAMTALRKEPGRRYASVAALADDLRRHLDGRPIEARPATLRYRLGKFARRRAGLVASLAAMAVLLITTTVLSTLLWLRAEHAQRRAGRERQTALMVNTVLEDMLSSVDPRVAQGEDVTLLKRLLDEAAARVRTELVDAPEVSADLHVTLGDAYSSIARYEEAEASYRAALTLQRARSGGKSSAMAAPLRGLALALEKRGELDEALARAEEAVTLLESSASADPAQLAEARMALGSILLTRGEHAKAEEVLSGNLSDLRAENGEGARLAAGLMHLAAVYLDPENWRPAVAEPLLREALGIWRSLGESRRIDVAGAAKQLGLVVADAENLAEAETLYQEALGIERELLDPNHPDLAITLNRLATVSETRRNYADAETLYREALAIYERALGPEHPDLGSACNNLAGVLRKTGRFAEAESLYRRAVDIYSASRGPDDAWTGIALGSLAVTLEWMGEYTEAERVTEECLRVRALTWPEGHWRLAIVESVRGACLAARGEYEEAERVLLESTQALAEQLGEDGISARQGYARLARLYEAWDRIDRAEHYRAKLDGEELPPGIAQLPAARH